MPNDDRGSAGMNQSFIRPLADFFHREAGAGVLLVIAAFIAMVWANSPWADTYFEILETHGVIGLGDFEINLTVKEWINDAAMSMFFLVVGLEIKRELCQGELRDPRQAALPIIGALGGMIVPALIYAVINAGGPGQDGWGIPMATDIAIVKGAVALIGTRAPAWLRLFLLALAIVDDIGAIIVIAVFYSEGFSAGWFAVAVASVALAFLTRKRIYAAGFYITLGTLCWIALHEAHIHPTLAGVVFGVLAPITPVRQTTMIDADEFEEQPTVENAFRVSHQARESVSIVEWLEHRLHPYTAFLIVPIFALANAGVAVPSGALSDAMSSNVTWGVIAGLVIGKTVGITAFTLVAAKTGIGTLPDGVTPRYVLGAGALGGIGFTVSLFVTELAFHKGTVGDEARLGVLFASLVAGALGALILLPGVVRQNTPIADFASDRVEPTHG